MKKIITLILGVAVLFSCQQVDIDSNTEITGKPLKVTAYIDGNIETRMSYDTTYNSILPHWEDGDEVFGFDNAGGTFTFTVTRSGNNEAELSVPSAYQETYQSNGATKLYAIFAPSYSVANLSNNTLSIDLASQGGVLDASTPALMCATGSIVNNEAELHFTNQTAIIGVKKFQLNGVSAVSEVTGLTINGVITGGIIAVDQTTDKLKLTPGSTISSITASGSWETDASGICTTAVYFAAMPTDNADLTLSATTGTSSFDNLSSIKQSDIEAGKYYYLSKKLGTPVAAIGRERYETIDAAWAVANAAKSDVTLTLLANCTADATLTLNNSGSGAVTLDLNGKTLTGPSSNPTLSISNSRSLTVCDNSTSNVANQGALVGVSNAHTVYAYEGTIEISGGTINAPRNHDKAALWIQTSSSATMSGGKLDASSSNYMAAYVGSGSSLTVSDGDIESHLQCIYSIGTTTITGGKFESKTTYPVYSVGTGNISVSGGYFSSQSTSVELFNVAKLDDNTGTCTVTGGCFDRAINSYRTARCNTLNDEAETKATHPFKVGNYAKKWIIKKGSNTYNHATVGCAVTQANSAAADVTMTPNSDANHTSTVSFTLNNPSHTITLDIKGQTVGKTSSGKFITAGGKVIITDSGTTKGILQAAYSPVIDITSDGAEVELDGIEIKCTKATGSSWNGDAVINLESNNGSLDIQDAKVYSTKKLSTLRAYKGTVTIDNSELSSGTESAGWYTLLALNLSTITVNSGSFYTSGTSNSSSCHIAYNEARVTINDGYFYSNGRTVSAGDKSYYNKMTLNSGYYNQLPSVPSSGTGQDHPNYGAGLSMQAITPTVSFPHSIVSGLVCGYQVKAIE